MTLATGPMAPGGGMVVMVGMVAAAMAMLVVVIGATVMVTVGAEVGGMVAMVVTEVTEVAAKG